MTGVAVLIPARMASARLPSKPLALVRGVPMIVHVLRRALAADVGPVWVATDSRDIARAIEAANGQVVMTSAAHPSGTDRIAEAMALIDPQRAFGIVLNVQGDQPEIDPAHLRAALALLDDPAVDIATLAGPLGPGEKANSDVVKVVGTAVARNRLRAHYFTRAPAPAGEGPDWHHIGIYAYRRAALERVVALPVSALEARERLEQWRALEAGLRIDVALVSTVSRGIDTSADLEALRQRFASKTATGTPD